jgi:hypothetical protein
LAKDHSNDLEYWPSPDYALQAQSFSSKKEFTPDAEALAEVLFEYGALDTETIAGARKSFLIAQELFRQAGYSVSQSIKTLREVSLREADFKGPAEKFGGGYLLNISSTLRLMDHYLQSFVSHGVSGLSLDQGAASEFLGFFIHLENYVVSLLSKPRRSLETDLKFATGPFPDRKQKILFQDRNDAGNFFGRFHAVRLYKTGTSNEIEFNESTSLWAFDIKWEDWGTAYTIPGAALSECLRKFRSAGLAQSWYTAAAMNPRPVTYYLRGMRLLGVPTFDTALEADNSSPHPIVRVKRIRKFKGMLFVPQKVMGAINSFHNYYGFLPALTDLQNEEMKHMIRSPFLSQEVLKRAIFLASSKNEDIDPPSDLIEKLIVTGFSRVNQARNLVSQSEYEGQQLGGVLTASFIFAGALRRFVKERALLTENSEDVKKLGSDLLDYLSTLLTPELSLMELNKSDVEAVPGYAQMHQYIYGNSHLPHRAALETINEYINAVTAFMLSMGNLATLSPSTAVISKEMLESRHALESISLRHLLYAERVSLAKNPSALNDLLVSGSDIAENLSFLLKLQQYTMTIPPDSEIKVMRLLSKIISSASSVIDVSVSDPVAVAFPDFFGRFVGYLFDPANLKKVDTPFLS